MQFLWALGAVIIVSLVSLVGVFSLPLSDKKLRSSLILMVSFAAGALLGDVLLHIFPEAVREVGGFTFAISIPVFIGIIFSLMVEKVIHWHHCHNPGEHVHAVGIISLFGDAVHNFIDGVLIAASFLVSVPVGVATTIAVVAHEIPHELGNFAILVHSGFTKHKAILANFATACTAVLGAIFVFALSQVTSFTHFLLPFAAGNFLYISLADLVPELHKQPEAKTALAQIICFLLGIGVMVLVLFLG